MKKYCLKSTFLFFAVAVVGLPLFVKAQGIAMGDAAWYCGVSNHGELMPMKNGYRADFSSNYGNQVQPLLISNDGQTVWAEQAYEVTVRNDTLFIASDHADVIHHKSGSTLRDAFLYASKTYFPPTGQMPDELLFSAPQYNTWIELMYDQNQEDILKYASAIKQNGFPSMATSYFMTVKHITGLGPND